MTGWRTALAGVALLASAGAGTAQSVTGAFDVRLGPMQIGRGTFEAQFGAGTYALGVSARVTGVARLVAGGEGQASAQGAMRGGRLVPELYTIANTAGELNNDIRLVMRGGGVVSESVQPPSIPLPDRIPVHQHHRRGGVVDPLSAFIFPVEGEPMRAENCQRTLRVYDGRARYDIAMSYDRTETVRARGFEGEALVCRARYTPVAGHRRPADGAPAGDVQGPAEAWLVPVPGVPALVLYRMQVGMGVGRLVVQASQLSLPGPQQQAAR